MFLKGVSVMKCGKCGEEYIILIVNPKGMASGRPGVMGRCSNYGCKHLMTVSRSEIDRRWGMIQAGIDDRELYSNFHVKELSDKLCGPLLSYSYRKYFH